MAVFERVALPILPPRDTIDNEYLDESTMIHTPSHLIHFNIYYPACQIR